MKFSELVDPTPKQRVFISAVLKYKWVLYGGARGGGKSYILRWLAIYLLLRWAQQGHKAVRVGIFCETFPTLRGRQLNRARMGRLAERYPLWLGKWNMEDKEFRIDEKYGGGIVCFRNLDDPAKYQSEEFAAMLIDEWTRNPITTISALQGSLRWPGIEHTPMVGATNPGGINHAGAKDMFIDKTFELDENKNFIDKDPKTGIAPFTKDDFHYVKATAYDNPHNAASYLNMLRALPARLRAAFLDGNWDVFEGQAFDEFDRNVHVTRANTIQHLRTWRLVVGLDWGFRKGVALMAAISGEGDVEVIHEVVFSKINADDAGFQIPKRWDKIGLKPELILYDEQMDQSQSHAIKGATKLSEQFLSGLMRHYAPGDPPPFVPGPHGRGSRKVKYDLTHKFLRFKMDEHGNIQPWNRPRLRIQPRCKYLIRTLPALQVDPDRPEDDVDIDSPDDHAYDALGFILASRVFDLEELDEPDVGPDRHPGMDPKKKARKRRPAPTPESEQLEPDYESPGWRMPRDEDLTIVEV